jgi:shikimate kinase
MNLVLIGMMGSGKSTVGRLLAGALGRPFYDTDTLVELQSMQLIRQIFAQEGEAGFRRREVAAVQEATVGSGRVIATGGGTVLNPANRALLRLDGYVIWLDAEPEELHVRALRQGGASRPLLAGPDPLAALRRLREERAEAYRATAHIRIDVTGRTPEEVAAEIQVRFEADKGDTGECRK